MLYSITKDLHEYSPDVLISDGVKYAADKYDLSWFLNIICKYKVLNGMLSYEFQVWELNRDWGNKFVITCLDDQENMLQKLFWRVEFPKDHFQVLVIGSVILLPSEY
jgi:hypothetical protein